MATVDGPCVLLLVLCEEEEEKEEEEASTSSRGADTAMWAWTRSLSLWFGVRVFIGVLQEWPRWSSTVAVVCAWLVFLVLLALCSLLLSAGPCGPDSAESCAVLGPVVVQRQVPDLVRTVQRCPWRFHRCCSWMRLWSLRQVPWSSAAVPQLQFDCRRHPCFCAIAVPYGPDCSENHRDSPVARRHGGRCSFRAGCTGSHVQVVGGTVVLPQFLLVEKIAVSFEVVDIPVVTQRPFPMVQLVWRTMEISQLQFALGGQCSDYAGRAGSWLSSSLSWRRGFPMVQPVLRTFEVSISS